MCHRDDGRGVFGAWPVRMRSIKDYYYGSLVYGNLRSGGSQFKSYDNSIMNITKNTFLKWKNPPPVLVTVRNKVQHPVRIVPAPFYAMRYVNNQSYLPGDEAPEAEKLRKTRKNNVAFYLTECTSNATYFG